MSLTKITSKSLFCMSTGLLYGNLPSFPTRRSSDLMLHGSPWEPYGDYLRAHNPLWERSDELGADVLVVGHTHEPIDRKSTRLNSSHLVISYAVFCLKKKKPTS